MGKTSAIKMMMASRAKMARAANAQFVARPIFGLGNTRASKLSAGQTLVKIPDLFEPSSFFRGAVAPQDRQVRLRH